jgi:very-short-patch-repair endonuclease
MEKSPLALQRARSLRQSETEAERKLWGYLRDRRLGGYKFRRQVPVPPFVADFLCLSHLLIVEVDGATHGDQNEVQYDARRTQFLNDKGFRVHRVSNIDVFRSMTDVLDGILIILQEQNPR